MVDAIVGGQVMEFKTLNFTLQNNADCLRRLRDTRPVSGSFEVTGSLTTYFQNDALLAAILSKPHKATIWNKARPKLYRAITHGSIAALVSFLLATGAY